MKPDLDLEGRRALLPSWSCSRSRSLAGAGIVAASHFYLDKEKRDSVGAARRVQEARARLDSARRERDSLHESADVFRTLVERGLLQSERRLDMVELVNQLRARHQLYALEYEIAPQRLLDAHRRPRLHLGRRPREPREAARARAARRRRLRLHRRPLAHAAGLLSGRSLPAAPHRRSASTAPQAVVEADCTLEWITLREKRGG
jgi:hypothetical protein